MKIIPTSELDTQFCSFTSLEFFVPGNPKPQGSKRHVGHGIMIESSKDLGPWRERIALAAHQTLAGQPLIAGPIALYLAFVLPRPKSAPKRRTPPAIKRPDIDKLARACLDAITATVIHDDSQITELRATKRLAEIGEAPGVHIHVATATMKSDLRHRSRE
jgi:crossover junction endodeoxyribonuclease RusA